MLAKIKKILEIQEYDMQMIRLLRLRKEREKELGRLHKLRQDLKDQAIEKKQMIESFEKEIEEYDKKMEEILSRMKKLDQRQSSIKKVDEFNALTQEMSTLEKEKIKIETLVSDLTDKMDIEKEILTKIDTSLEGSKASSEQLEKEVGISIEKINHEGREIKGKRDVIAKSADAETLVIYEKLLKNKKDRVVVPIENRTCSGCHIVLTPQHENVVRRAEKIVYCEHCSRIHFWQEEDVESDLEAAPKRRRRRARISS